MKIKHKSRIFYVQLPKQLYNEVKAVCSEQENIDFEFAVLLIHLILREGKFNEPTQLHSLFLKQFNFKNFKYNEHLKFLEDFDFITIHNHINNIQGKTNRAKLYQINQSYFKDSTNEILNVRLNNDAIFNSYNKFRIKRRIKADYKTNHLTKWLKKENFEIDYDLVKKSIENDCSENFEIINNTHLTLKKFIEGVEFYSREGKDDRLHNCFTRLPRNLRKFIRFSDNKLCEVDIISCQPILLSFLLNLIITTYENTKYKRTLPNRIANLIYNYLKTDNKKEKEYIYSIIKRVSLNIYSIICPKPSKTIDFTDIRDFIFTILSKDIYLKIGEELFNKKIITKHQDKYYVMLYNKDKSCQTLSEFESLRECGKKIMLNTIYASPKSNNKAINELKKLYPTTFLLIDSFKKGKKEDLAILLQRFESKMVLDKITNKISKIFPDMPLITIHDSILTIEDRKEDLEKIFQSEINKYLGNHIPLKVSVL